MFVTYMGCQVRYQLLHNLTNVSLLSIGHHSNLLAITPIIYKVFSKHFYCMFDSILQVNDHFHVGLLQVDQDLLVCHGPLRLILNDLQTSDCYIHRKLGSNNSTYQIDGLQQVQVVIVPPGELSNRAGNDIINIAKSKLVMIPTLNSSL